MHRILFVCHGNICRSPMAAIVLCAMAEEKGVLEQFEIDSAATSMEEFGHTIYPPARAVLLENGYPCPLHHARLITREDYLHFDCIYIMDERNRQNILRLLGGDPDGKIKKLLPDRDVEDPYYSDRYDLVMRDIEDGCRRILSLFEM